ncbi:MAG: GerMN domain-containing protein [Synergistaceae bacterium]|nr:GerMN domain-containing protein [Synergistota bacterium]NLM71506.1 GerMN domain-containing protein [Synergistaceae bacterium]
MRRRDDDYDDVFEVHRDADISRSRRSRRDRRPEKKAPLAVRLIAWTGVVVFCFAAGYVGTSIALRMLNRQGILGRGDVVAGREDAERMIDEGPTEIRLSAKKVTFAYYYPSEGVIVSDRAEFLSGIMEDDIRQVVDRVFRSAAGDSAADVRLLNLFRSGDTLFLNFNSPFLGLLGSLGAQGSALLITGVVQTMSENFSPIVQVRFLVDGKEQQGSSPVDLSVPWRLPKG